MAATDREIYERLLEVSRGVIRLENSIDELLAGARASNEEFSADVSNLAKRRGGPSQRST